MRIPQPPKACRAVLLLLALGVRALGAQADTLSPGPFFIWRDAAILGGFVVATVAIEPLDKSFAERLQNPSVQENQTMRRAAEFVRTVADPGSVIIGVGMYTYGRLAKKRRAADLGLHGTEALLVGAEVGTLLKGVIGRARPYLDITRPHDYQIFRGFRSGTAYQSFPSGHTIAAFAAASAVTSETKRWYPKSVWFVAPAMYGGAAAVGWSRMFNNKHWASDVITGAAIGTFSGLKVVTWQHRHPGNKVDRIFLGTTLRPGADGSTLVLLNWRSPF